MPESQSKQPGKPEPRRRILVVDDEKNIRLMLVQALTDSRTTVKTAVNGEEALHLIDKAPFHLVLLDLRLPGMDGLEFLREIQTRKPKLPVILLTAHGTVESAVEALRGGAVNYLQKPFAPQELREAVENALQSSTERSDDTSENA